MNLNKKPGALKRFHKTSWKFQQTFQTPLKNLRPFVTAILSAASPLHSGSLTVKHVIFEPKHLNDLLISLSIPTKYEYGLSLMTSNSLELDALLFATFSDWIDFIFTPDPKPFVIYADHDEYTTFYAQTRSNLNRAIQSLSLHGFEPIPGYERRL